MGGFIKKVLQKTGKFFTRALGEAGTALLESALYVGGALLMATHPYIAVALLSAGAFIQVSVMEYEKSLLEDSIKDNGHLINTYGRIEAPIPLVYGRTKIGGNVIFLKTADSNGDSLNEDLLSVMTLSEGKISDVFDIQLDDTSLFDGVVENLTKFTKKTNKEWRFKVPEDCVKVKLSLTITTHYMLNGQQAAPTDTCHPIVIERGQSGTLNLSNYPSNVIYNAIIVDFTTSEIKIVASDSAGYVVFNSSLDPVPYTNNGKIDINSIVIENLAFNVNGEIQWRMIDKKKENYLDFLYFDGKDLYRIVKGSSLGEGWNLVDYNDDLFKIYFVDNGFYNEIISENTTNKYLDVYNKLKEIGVAMLFSKITYNKDIWKKVPEITAVVDGITRATPFNNTEHLLTNPVEILYDYMTNTAYGAGIPESKLDLTLDANGNAIGGSWLEAYNYANYKGFSYNGVIKNGKIDEIIGSLLLHFKGDIVYERGKFRLIINDLPYEIQNNLVYPDIVEVEEGNDTFQMNYSDLSEFYDQIEATYINETINYKTDKIRIPETLPVANKTPNRKTLSLHGCSTTQAKALATYYLERSRLATTVSFITSQKYIDLRVGQAFRLSYKDWGVENQWFRCTSIKPTIDGKLEVQAIIEDEDLHNLTYEPNIYDIDLTNLPSPLSIPDDVSPTLELSSKQVDGRTIYYLSVSWQDLPYVKGYNVYMSNDGNSYHSVGYTEHNNLDIYINGGGTYHVKVQPISDFGVSRRLEDCSSTSITIPDDIFRYIGLRAIANRLLTPDNISYYAWGDNLAICLSNDNVIGDKVSHNQIYSQTIRSNDLIIHTPETSFSYSYNYVPVEGGMGLSLTPTENGFITVAANLNVKHKILNSSVVKINDNTIGNAAFDYLDNNNYISVDLSNDLIKTVINSVQTDYSFAPSITKDLVKSFIWRDIVNGVYVVKWAVVFKDKSSNDIYVITSDNPSTYTNITTQLTNAGYSRVSNNSLGMIACREGDGFHNVYFIDGNGDYVKFNLSDLSYSIVRSGIIASNTTTQIETATVIGRTAILQLNGKPNELYTLDVLDGTLTRIY